jgi:hypothetical protein
MNEKLGQRMIELCLTMKIDKCRCEKCPSNWCNWDVPHRTEEKAYKYVSVYGRKLKIRTRQQAAHLDMATFTLLTSEPRLLVRPAHLARWHIDCRPCRRRSLTLQRTVKKVQRIRADKRAKIRRKVNHSIWIDRSRGGFCTNTTTRTLVLRCSSSANCFIHLEFERETLGRRLRGRNI